MHNDLDTINIVTYNNWICLIKQVVVTANCKHQNRCFYSPFITSTIMGEVPKLVTTNNNKLYGLLLTDDPTSSMQRPPIISVEAMH